MRLDVFHHFPPAPNDRRIGQILALLQGVAERVQQMPTLADFQAAVANINTNLDGIQSDLDTLKALLQNNTGGMSASDVQAALDLVTAVQTRTQSIDQQYPPATPTP